MDSSNNNNNNQQTPLTAEAIAAAQPGGEPTATTNSTPPDLGGDSESASGSSSNGGNNSDNSALVSIGNTSFGFNFDSDERMSNRSSTERQENSSEDNSDDGNEGSQSKKNGSSTSSIPKAPAPGRQNSSTGSSGSGTASSSSSSSSNGRGLTSSVSSLTATTDSGAATAKPAAAAAATSSKPKTKEDVEAAETRAHNEASNRATANLKNLMESCAVRKDAQQPASFRKRKAADDNNDNNDDANSGGYNTDDEGNIMVTDSATITATASSSRNAAASKATASAGRSSAASQASSNKSGSGGAASATSANNNKKQKKIVNDKKREERNAREKERSFRISKQIDDLRNVLSSGGVIVPKGTKSSVLTEAANYIRMLQQHQYRSEIDRHQLIQQMQMIGGGAHGPQAAQTIRQVAAQQGVWSLGNFGGAVPPKAVDGIVPNTPQSSGEVTMQQEPVVSSSQPDAMHPTKIDASEYRSVFNSCGVGMAIASMGGAFIDCNQLFCHISNYARQELCSLTLFNLTARQDLQHAFDLICKIISPPMTSTATSAGDELEAVGSTSAITSAAPIKNIVLRGAMKNRNGIGLCISLVKGEDGVAKCFCVTLIKDPSSPFDTAKPVPLSFESATAMLNATTTTAATTQISKDASGDNNPGATRPTFTSG